MDTNGLEFKSNGDGTCQLVVSDDFAEEILRVPEKSPDGDKVISVIVAGVLFNKDMTTLISCPSGMSGKFVVPSSVRTVAKYAVYSLNCFLEEIIFQEGLQRTEEGSLSGVKIITLPASLTHIDEETFDGEYMFHKPTIRAPKNSAAHRFAVKKGYRYMPTDCPVTWNADVWLKKFRADGADYRALRREVWENTRAIVEDNGYTLPDGNSVLLMDAKRYSQFYYKPFRASFVKLTTAPEITVTADDCLDAAHKWVADGLEVCVLNMANRQNPGGGVTGGAGAQEEYLFRCTDYHKFLYRYAPYAEQYGVTRSHYQYPLERNFGGIFSSGVTVFRENEENGYRLLPKPWKVNMIAVAGMNSPRLVYENGEERIAPELVDGVKNKIRTIFRIACDRGQKNLVLGALGCGAFHNPPKHVAELFRDVLCEQEFFGAFKKICFAVKTSHTSKGDTNFAAFKGILDGFIPTLKADSPDQNFELTVKKIAIARNSYALLKTNGQVQIVDNNGKSHYYRRFRKIIDIAAGFNHFIGLREDGSVVFKSVGSQAPKHHGIHWFGGISVAACEMHSAMVKADGTVCCFDYPNDSPSGYPPTPEYSRIVESWHNIKQVALTYEMPFALTRDGKFLCERNDINKFFNDCGKEIVQISASGAYYTEHVIAALYADGTVKACEVFSGNYIAHDEIESWRNVKKICCSCSVVIGLTNDGKILIPSRFKQDHDKSKRLENIVDISDSGGFIALSSTGEIIC